MTGNSSSLVSQIGEGIGTVLLLLFTVVAVLGGLYFIVDGVAEIAAAGNPEIVAGEVKRNELGNHNASEAEAERIGEMIAAQLCYPQKIYGAIKIAVGIFLFTGLNLAANQKMIIARLNLANAQNEALREQIKQVPLASPPRQAAQPMPATVSPQPMPVPVAAPQPIPVPAPNPQQATHRQPIPVPSPAQQVQVQTKTQAKTILQSSDDNPFG